MIENEAQFEQLIAEAAAQPFSGWNFSWLRGRWHEDDVFWDYRQIVQAQIAGVRSLLDMGTGGGEFLEMLAPLPENTQATEAWQPNIPIATARLAPLGVTVHAVEEDAALPLPDATFEHVINRHESYDPAEVRRVLIANGRFITQQVGDQNDRELVEFLTGKRYVPDFQWSLDVAVRGLRDAGFTITRQAEDHVGLTFHDIGAVVYYLRAVPWMIPDFDVTRYREALGRLHNQILHDGGFSVTKHRFLIVATRDS